MEDGESQPLLQPRRRRYITLANQLALVAFWMNMVLDGFMYSYGLSYDELKEV